MKERRKGREKSEVFILSLFKFEAPLGEDQVCFCVFVLCSREKVKYGPIMVYVHTQTLNTEQEDAWIER